METAKPYVYQVYLMLSRALILFVSLSIEQLPLGSTVYSIDASNGDVLYIGGQFASSTNTTGLGFQNIVAYSKTSGQLMPLENTTTLSGVNGKVSKVLLHATSKLILDRVTNISNQ